MKKLFEKARKVADAEWLVKNTARLTEIELGQTFEDYKKAADLPYLGGALCKVRSRDGGPEASLCPGHRDFYTERAEEQVLQESPEGRACDKDSRAGIEQRPADRRRTILLHRHETDQKGAVHPALRRSRLHFLLKAQKQNGGATRVSSRVRRPPGIFSRSN